MFFSQLLQIFKSDSISVSVNQTGGVSCWCPESGLNKVRLRFSFMLLKSGTVFQKTWDRPQLWQCLNPGWKQFYFAAHMTTESIYLHFKALWIALCTNCALQINLPCLNHCHLLVTNTVFVCRAKSFLSQSDSEKLSQYCICSQLCFDMDFLLLLPVPEHNVLTPRVGRVPYE